MKALLGMLLVAAALLAGCSGVPMGGAGRSTISTDQQICEQSRGGGVWIAAAGACVRGGGAM